MRPLCVLRISVSFCMMLGATGCDSSKTPNSSKSGSSVTWLEEKLPNLSEFGITSCSYTVVRRAAARSAVPSPSDTELELSGYAVLSDVGVKKLKSQSDWKPAKRAQLPVVLSRIAPSGDVLISESLNKTFSKNGTYAHGVVVMLADDRIRLYFVAHDLDHPLD